FAFFLLFFPFPFTLHRQHVVGDTDVNFLGVHAWKIEAHDEVAVLRQCLDGGKIGSPKDSSLEGPCFKELREKVIDAAMPLLKLSERMPLALLSTFPWDQ